MTTAKPLTASPKTGEADDPVFVFVQAIECRSEELQQAGASALRLANLVPTDQGTEAQFNDREWLSDLKSEVMEDAEDIGSSLLHSIAYSRERDYKGGALLTGERLPNVRFAIEGLVMAVEARIEKFELRYDQLREFSVRRGSVAKCNEDTREAIKEDVLNLGHYLLDAAATLASHITELGVPLQ